MLSDILCILSTPVIAITYHPVPHTYAILAIAFLDLLRNVDLFVFSTPSFAYNIQQWVHTIEEKIAVCLFEHKSLPNRQRSMGCIYTGPNYIKRQSDSDNFLTFWYTLGVIVPFQLDGKIALLDIKVQR